MARHSTCPYLSAKFEKSVFASPRWSFGLKLKGWRRTVNWYQLRLATIWDFGACCTCCMLLWNLQNSMYCRLPRLNYVNGELWRYVLNECEFAKETSTPSGCARNWSGTTSADPVAGHRWIAVPKGSENLHQINKPCNKTCNKKSKSDFSWFPAKTLKIKTQTWINFHLPSYLLCGISGGKAITAVIFWCLWQRPKTGGPIQQLIDFYFPRRY